MMGSFKKWLTESGGIHGGMHPPREDPVWLLRKYKGAMPQYDDEPLPGNTKPMKKQMKKKMKKG